MRKDKGVMVKRKIYLLLLSLFFFATVASAQTVTVGSIQTVMTPSQLSGHGLTDFPDSNLHCYLLSGVYNCWGADGDHLDTQGFTSVDLNNLQANLTKITTSTNLSLGASGAFDQNYAGGSAIYNDVADGILIMVYHGEFWYSPPSGSPFYASLGLAYSTDHGANWNKLGQIISPQTARSGSCQVDTGVGTLLVVGSYFYVYYDDEGSGCDTSNFNVAVARAPISSVIAAAMAGTPFTSGAGTLFMKYTGSGTWTGNGVTNLASPASGGGAFTPLFTGNSAWVPTVVWDGAVNEYAMAYSAAWNGIGLRFSPDGLSWDAERLIVNSGGMTPPNAVFYPALLNTAGGDPENLGPQFYAYYVDPFGDWTTSNLKRVSLTTAEEPTVDLSVNNGASTYRGSGFLAGYNSSTPGSSLVNPVNGKLLRMDAGLENQYCGSPCVLVSSALYSRATGLGASVMYIIGDAWTQNWGGFNPTGSKIVDSSSTTAFENMVTEMVNLARSNSQTITWDIWNEPDTSAFWTGTEAQYQTMWKNAVNTIRGIDSGQQIAGPSTCCAGTGTAWGTWATDLMAYAKTNSVLPNIVAFHATQTGSSYTAANMNSDINAAKAYLAANDPSITKIDVTEEVSQNDVYLPGTNTQFMAVAERQQLNGVAHSCWNSGNDCAQNGFPPDLDGLLGTDATTVHAAWYAYQGYASITGNIAGVTSSTTVDGVAGLDASAKSSTAVFGRHGATGTVIFTYNNIPSYLISGGNTNVALYNLANDGGSGSGGYVLISNGNVAVVGSSISVVDSTLGTNDAAKIVLTTPSGGGGGGGASDIYMSQSGTGGGTSCADTRSASWFNTSGNWGGGAGQVAAGKTVHICGTISSQLNFQGSGASGNPITLLAESGGNLSQPVGQLINLQGNSHIILDGGTNGIIQNTANGTNLANHVMIRAIEGDGSGDIEIRNWTARGLYVHVAPGQAFDGGTSGCGGPTLDESFSNFFYAYPTSGNIKIHNNTISDVAWAIGPQGPTVNGIDYQVYDNVITNMNHGPYGGGDTFAFSFEVYGNQFGSMANWDTTYDCYHHDSIHFFTGSPNAADTYTFHDNLFTGDPGVNNTANIFLEEAQPNVLEYNNIFEANATNSYNNGFVNNEGGPNWQVYNESFIGAGANSSGCMEDRGGSVKFENNLLVGCNNFVSIYPGVTITSWDYNIYATVAAGGNNAWNDGSNAPTNSFTAWQGYGHDTHGSYQASPGLTGYVPNNGSPPAGAGTNLTSLSIAGLDIDSSAGNTRGQSARPGSGAWDVGCCNAAGGGGGTPVATLSMSSYSFGSLAVGSSTSFVNFSIQNTGTGTLSITGSSALTDSTDFTNSGTCVGSNLTNGQSCTVQLKFNPASVGSFSATFGFIDNASGSPHLISISGTGTCSSCVMLDSVGPSSAGAAAGFTAVWVSPESVTWSHTVSSSATLLVVGVATSIHTDDTESTSCTWNGTTMSLLTLQHADGTDKGYGQIFYLLSPTTGTHNVVCTVTGMDTSNHLSIIGGSMSFLNAGSLSNLATAGGLSQNPTVNVTGGNSFGLYLSVVVAGSPLAGDTQSNKFTNNFDLTSGAGNIMGSLAPGGTAATFGYQIPSEVDYWADMGVFINQATGTPVASLSASSLNFGSQTDGTTSATQTVTFTNTGTANLVFTGSPALTTGTQYSIVSNSCSGTLGPSLFCTTVLTFGPSLTGTLTDTLTYTDNAGTGTQTVGLTGVGIPTSPTGLGVTIAGGLLLQGHASIVGGNGNNNPHSFLVFNSASGFTFSSLGTSKIYPNAVRAGDLLVAAVWVNTGHTDAATVTDTVNGTWSPASATVGSANNAGIFYICSTAAGTPTVTVSGGSGNWYGLHVWEVSGAKSTGCYDQGGEGVFVSVTSITASILSAPLTAADVLFTEFAGNNSATYSVAGSTGIQFINGSFGLTSQTSYGNAVQFSGKPSYTATASASDTGNWAIAAFKLQ